MRIRTLISILLLAAALSGCGGLARDVATLAWCAAVDNDPARKCN